MASTRAELVFVKGPQAGERATLMGDSATVGRSPGAEVTVREECVSREHFRLSRTPDGWVFENLSGNGTRINGKIFKSAKKQVLLGTGDVLAVGGETEMLFVDAGDDAVAALERWRGEAAPVVTASPPPASASPLPAVEEEPAAATSAGSAPHDEASEAPADDESGKRRKKYIKYGVMFGVYALVLVAGAILLSSGRSDDEDADAGPTALVRLTRQEIADILRTPIAASPNSTAAQLEEVRALSYYDKRRLVPGGLYLCVRSFKLHKAYVNSAMRPETERIFNDAMNELVTDVADRYETAWKYEQDQNWPLADKYYNDLRKALPEEDTHNEVRSRLLKNINDHQMHVSKQLKKKRR